MPVPRIKQKKGFTMNNPVLIRIPKNARYFSPRVGSTTLWLWQYEATVVALKVGISNLYSFVYETIGNKGTSVYHVFAEDVEVLNDA